MKIEITKTVLEALGKENDENSVKKIIPIWWYSLRIKNNGGLRLTEKGFQAFKNADIKHYRIFFDEPIYFSNQLILGLDCHIKYPYYLEHKSISVFSDRLAIELALFSGNLYRYCQIKAKSS